MRPVIYPNCKLYYFNRDTLEFGTINPNLVDASIINGYIYYNLLQPKEYRFLIVQALNAKKASAKMLTLISKEEKK